MTATEETFEGWAIVEIMGHRRLAGYVRAVTMFGAPMCRVDVPFHDKEGVQLTQYYGGSSVFSVTPTTEERAKAMAPRPAPEPAVLQLPGDESDEEDEDEAADDSEVPW